MEGLTQEDNEVIVIDDSFDGDIPGNETLLGTGKTAETESEPSESETAPDGSAESETAPDRSGNSVTAPDGSPDSETAPNRSGNSETAPDGSGNSETAPDGSGNSETAPDGSGNSETAPDGSANAETAPRWYSEPEIPPGITEKSLAKPAVTTSGQGKTVSFKGRVIHVHADVPVSSLEGYSGRDTASEHLHLEEVLDANCLENQQQCNTDLTAETCQSSTGESSKTEGTSVDARSEFSRAASLAEKVDTHSEKADKHRDARKALTPEKSSESEPVNSSLDIRSVEKSSDDTPLTCSMDDESISGDVQNECLVTPTSSSRELGSDQIPSETTSKQLTPPGTKTTSYKCGQELPQSPQAPRYFIIRNRNTAAKQEPARKPGDKLTSLLQRLTSAGGAKVSVKLSTMTKPRSLPDTKAEVNPSLLPISPAVYVGSTLEKPAVSQHAVTETSPRMSEKPTVKCASMSQEPFPMSTPRLPPKTDSSTKADKNPSLIKAETSKTLSFTNVTAPATVSSDRNPVIVFPQVQHGKQAKKSHQISTSLVQTKPAEAFMKPGRQMFQVLGAVDDSKQSPNFPAALGVPALIPAGKLKYVLGYLPMPGSTSMASNIVLKGSEGQNIQPVPGSRASNIVLKGQNIQPVHGSRVSNIVLKGPEGQNILPVQGSTTSNIILKGPGGQNILLGKASTAHLPQPSSGVQKTTRKSKYQFSLLQNPSSKISEAVQINANLQGGARKPSPTVRSLLASSTTVAPVLNLPTSETHTANSLTSLSNVRATMAVQDMKKRSAFSNTENKKRTPTRQYKLGKPSQVLLQPPSQPAAVTESGNNLSPAATTVTFSKLAVPPSTSKACIVPVSSGTTGRPIFVMSTTGSPVPTLLIPSSGVNSKSLLAPGMITYSNIPATPNQSETLKTVSVTKTPEVNPTIQSSANTTHSFSELITRIALQNVPSTSANKPSSDGNSSMQALNLALLHQLRQQHGVSAAPVRIIVSQGSGVKSTAKLVYAQSPSGVYQCGTVTTPAWKTANVSKTAPKPVTVPGASSKQVPKLICPKPMSTDEVTGAPAKAKSISLLAMPLVRKNQKASECHGNASIADVVDKSYMITKDKIENVKSADSQLEDVKPKGSQIVEVSGLKETSANNATQKSKKEKASPLAPASKKRKNAVYTAILRTGQGPVSVRLVAPNMDDDSSDTMSDTGLSHFTLSEAEDTIGKESDIDSGPSVKFFESDIPDLLCSEPLANSDPETCDGAVLNTELQDMESSAEPVGSHHHQLQDFSGEETDTDTEGMAMEEQEISVLRQLLTNTGAKSLCNFETNQKVGKFSATSDWMSSARNQSGSELSADHKGLALLLSNLESGSSLDEVVIEEDGGAESCDLKIESVFSLRDPGDCQDTELPPDGQVYQELPDDKTELLPVFNVRTSNDWKSFLNPCFVVLERLSKSELLVGGNAKVASKCSGHCRKRTLDYLCNLNLLRCVNHPDPFLFQTPKLARVSVKKTLKKIISHEVINKKYIPEDSSNSFQIVKNIYGQRAVDEDESVMVMKTADLARVMSKFFPMVKDVGKSPTVVKETCVKKDLGKSPSVMKQSYVKRDLGKSPSVMKETCVKRVGKLPLVVKATARKSMNKSIPKVKLTFVKKPISVISPVTKEARLKASISELHVKEVDVKETLSTSPPLVKELCGENVSQLSHQLQEACVEAAMAKPPPVIKESDVVKPVPEYSFLRADVNQEQTCTPPETASVSDTVHLPATSSADHVLHTSTAQDDQKTDDNRTSDLDSVCSGPKSSQFSRALKQLQKQVNKKRVSMLTEKLSRKKHRGSSKKPNVRKCKIKLAGQKRTNKVAVKRLRKKRLSKNVLLSADMVKILTESRNAYKRARVSAVGKQNIISLPDLDQNVSHSNSPESILPPKKALCSTETPGAKSSSDPTITHLANVQTKNMKSKGQFVRLQPKMPGIPQEKIQSALQSLKSYLTATGRQPTTGNTQFILLKIDDQHVLVKWPATSLPLTQQSRMPSLKITPVTSSADNTQSKMNSDINKEKQNEAVPVTAAAKFKNTCNTVHSLASTSRVSAITATMNSTLAVTNPTSNITFLTNIVKTNSGSAVVTSGSSQSTPGKEKKEFRFIRTQQVVTSSQSSDKSSSCSASSVGTQQHIHHVTKGASVADVTNFTKSGLKTGPSLNKQKVISLLKSGTLSQAQSKVLSTFMSNASSAFPIVTSSPVVSRWCSKASSTASDGCKKTADKDTNVTLSRLPPNSMLLPGRKRPSSVLTEAERRAKRRRLEEKYPLPPGVMIKSEPDDLEDYLVAPGISPAFTANTSLIPTECTESLEPLIMSGDDQVWSVENSVNIGSFLTDSGYPAQEGVPVDFAVEDNLSSEPCLNAEDSSDEQDEPPALLDETLDDGDEDVRTEDITDAQEDAPPVLQPMFTSSNCSLMKDTDIEELESTKCVPEMSADVTTFVPYDRHSGSAREPSTSADSTSATSLFSENSMDSGVDTNFPNTSFSHTLTHGQIADRPLSKNLKIQYLKDLLKKKEMEIENMKRVQSELIPADFDI